MGNKLYVGNLPFGTTDADLEGIFGAHGAITSVNVITDRETGRSRGFGFVDFEEDSSAAAAQAALDGFDLEGRELRVNEAQDKSRA